MDGMSRSSSFDTGVLTAYSAAARTAQSMDGTVLFFVKTPCFPEWGFPRRDPAGTAALYHTGGGDCNASSAFFSAHRGVMADACRNCRTARRENLDGKFYKVKMTALQNTAGNAMYNSVHGKKHLPN
ncbi:MAG: hypothetical protein SO063_11005 [Eubacteriales bacterium]|nr:hypothetical protein [Eubacteriales bacterium]